MTESDPTRDLKLATARAYRDQYKDKPPSESRWIQAMRNANDAEIAQLEAQGAGDMIEASEAARAWTAVYDRIEELLGHKPDEDDVASYLHTIASFISERARAEVPDGE